MELKAQYLLYDENCPLCAWYTRLFVKYGFIASETRVSFQSAIESKRFSIDEERAKAEIALVTEGESTTYGVDSMLKVIGNRWSMVRAIGHFLPIYWMLQMLYRFISFNRKIIAPTVCKDQCACTPKFNAFWRVTFIVLGGQKYQHDDSLGSCTSVHYIGTLFPPTYGMRWLIDGKLHALAAKVGGFTSI